MTRTPASETSVPTRTVAVAPGVGGFLAKPRGRTGDGIVVVMEAYGLNEFVKETCRRFARAGYVACAPDHYHGETFAYGERDGAMGKLHDDGRRDDDGRGRRRARRARAGRRAAQRHHRLLHGRPRGVPRQRDVRRPAARVDLVLWRRHRAGRAEGAAQAAARPRARTWWRRSCSSTARRTASIPPDEQGRIAAALAGANKRFTLAVFPDAPHAFATFDRDSYREAQAKAAFRAAFQFLDEAFGRSEDALR